MVVWGTMLSHHLTPKQSLLFEEGPEGRACEMELTDIFSLFKSIHIPRPSNLDPAYVHTALGSPPPSVRHPTVVFRQHPL